MKKPRKESATWRVSIVRSKLTLLGTVEARDRDEALKKAIEQFEIREADRWRISVQRN